MSFKKSIAWIMGIVLFLTVVSGAFLYSQGYQSGGVSSTHEPKYDYVVDNSSYYEKEISGGARNGDLKTIGAACYEYSKVIVNAEASQEIYYEDYIVDSDWCEIVFYPEFPFQIELLTRGHPRYDIYIHFKPESSDDEYVECYLGNSSNITVTSEMMPGYGGERCQLYIKTGVNGGLCIDRCTIQMIPETYASGVTEVVALPKNMLDFVGIEDNNDKSVELIDTGFVFTRNRHYIVISVSLPEGFYTFSYTVSDDSLLKGYTNQKLSSPSAYLSNGDFFYTDGSIKCICLYRDISYTMEAFDVTNVQLERGFERTEYTTYFEPYTVLSIPSAITSLPEYGVGSGSYSNYLNLENGTYVQMCKLVDTQVELLSIDEWKVIDVSHYLPPGCGKLDLYGVGALRFVSPYGTDVQTDLSYRRLIN